MLFSKCNSQIACSNQSAPVFSFHEQGCWNALSTKVIRWKLYKVLYSYVTKVHISNSKFAPKFREVQVRVKNLWMVISLISASTWSPASCVRSAKVRNAEKSLSSIWKRYKPILHVNDFTMSSNLKIFPTPCICLLPDPCSFEMCKYIHQIREF